MNLAEKEFLLTNGRVLVGWMVGDLPWCSIAAVVMQILVATVQASRTLAFPTSFLVKQPYCRR